MYNLQAIKPTAIFKEQVSVAVSESELLPKNHLNSKIVGMMKHYKKMFVKKQFLSKAFSLLFLCSLKRLVCSEPKHISRHRLLVKYYSTLKMISEGLEVN